MSSKTRHKIPKYWHFAHLTASYTPILNQHRTESIALLVDSVGLYQGNFKIHNHQNGRIYLTNERLVYVDNDDPVNCSLYFKLIDVISDGGLKFYNGFLKSSPKITVRFKDDNNISDDSEGGLYEADGLFESIESTQSNKDKLKDPSIERLRATDMSQASSVGSISGNSDIFETGDFEIVSWKCKICQFVNKISSENYELDKLLNPNLNTGVKFPNCVNCGIQSTKNGIISAIKKSRNKKLKLKQKELEALKDKDLIDLSDDVASSESVVKSKNINQCLVCTFVNHPLMKNCEICGSSLNNFPKKPTLKNARNLIMLDTEDPSDGNKEAFQARSIKLSFRGNFNGGNNNNSNDLKKFLSKLQEMIDEANLKDIMKRANKNENVQKIIMSNPKGPSDSSVSNEAKTPRIKTGISALESNQGHIIKKNEFILESSLEDLNSLMSKAKELNNLIKSFDKVINVNSISNNEYQKTLDESKSTLGIGNTNDSFHYLVLNNNFNFLNKLDNKEIFYKELARNLAIFIQNFVFGIGDNSMKLITNEYSGGIISLIDLYSLYNISLGFNNNLISPSDLLESVSYFDSLKLPLKFRKFEKSGLLVIQDSKCTDEEILNQVTDFLINKKFRLQNSEVIDSEYQSVENKIKGSGEYFRGINIQTLVKEMNLSVAILQEILDIGLMNGSLLIDEDISGTSYYLNEIDNYEW
ncbi:ESCRT-II subunit protein [Saccharomycopsis crataegensis]|uniref:Vacuolar protein-sorting-associated protein 36 n=1 Tax=Saccharomycopsis crataegensis TaxID=43959 RepID=A0AAV5QTB9_9ASCO|nr:ESCRT-II subunit protein [Saccharomycopsis crataegensis]